MRLVLDGKSVTVGLFAGAALVAGLGAAELAESSPDRPQVGRYQVAAGGGPSGPDAYPIDTATGQVWREPQGPRTTQTYAAFLAPKLDAKRQ